MQQDKIVVLLRNTFQVLERLNIRSIIARKANSGSGLRGNITERHPPRKELKWKINSWYICFCAPPER